VGAIATSLVFVAAGQPLLVLTSGAHRVDEPTVAALLGVPSVERAPAELVRQVTGQPIGTLVDVELARYDRVWAAAGHPATVFPTTYEELLRLTDGTPAEVGPGPAGAAPHDVAEAVGT
jgi:prolyl-tRNA editing enzyme YbaK/EbsC (Cys-tRNA(Pro) deacylase)